MVIISCIYKKYKLIQYKRDFNLLNQDRRRCERELNRIGCDEINKRYLLEYGLRLDKAKKKDDRDRIYKLKYGTNDS